MFAPEVAGVSFSGSHSTSAPKLFNPGPVPGPTILQIWESDSCSDSDTIIHPTVIYPCCYLRNDRTDSYYCRNGKVTPVPGPVFQKFLTPGPDPRPKEKRRILPESTPVNRIRSHLWFVPEVCMDWILDFLEPDSGCLRQDPDSNFLNKNRIRAGFGFCNFMMKNGLWDWDVRVITNYI